MVLALNNLQRLICHKTKKPNQTSILFLWNRFISYILQKLSLLETCIVFLPLCIYVSEKMFSESLLQILSCYIYRIVQFFFCQVSWSCRILFLCQGVGLLSPPNVCPVYDTKQFVADVPIMQKLLGMQSTPLFPSVPVPLWPEMAETDRVLSLGKIGLNFVLLLN